MHNLAKTSFERGVLRLLPILCLLGFQTSCEQIIGLEDRVLVDGGGDGDGKGSSLCASYCSGVMKSCKPPDLDVFTSEKDCLAICKFLPPGKSTATETSKNTVSCRAHYAEEAASVERDAMFCPAATPGGGSPSAKVRCGDNCEAYCGLYKEICDKSPTNCLSKCRALPDRGAYSASTDYTMGGDTIQCRIAHLTAAARAKDSDSDAERVVHCGHANLPASLSDAPCDVKAGTVPNCKDYCRIVTQACSEFPVYENAAQCEKFCDGAFEKGKNTDETGAQDQTKDTLACRRWHSYFAFDDQAKTHCPHAGPTGDGHCGQICPSYCAMLKRGCGSQFATEFPGADGQAACETACRALPGAKDRDMGYDLGAEESRTDPLKCRMRHLVNSFNGVDSCSKALPKGTCSI